jgi:hypothetical protein
VCVEDLVRLIETTDDPGRHDVPQRAVVNVAANTVSVLDTSAAR